MNFLVVRSTQPNNSKRRRIVWVMRFNIFIPAHEARYFLNFSRSKRITDSKVCSVALRILGSVLGSVMSHPSNALRCFGSLTIVGANPVDVFLAVMPNVRLVAWLALVDVTVSHPWVLVEVGEWLNLSALEALLRLHDQNGIESSASSKPLAAGRGAAAGR